jgi:hypothetical protein
MLVPPITNKPRLLDEVRAVARMRHLSIRTEQAYVQWIRRFIVFHKKRHLTWLTAAASTQTLGRLSSLRLNQMRRSLLLLGFILFSLFPLRVLAGFQQFSTPQLTTEGQKAYQVLLTASRFEDDADDVIACAAQPSKLVEGYRILLKEPSADRAFKNLLERATPAGQLYALCGIYYSDHPFFLAVLRKHTERTDYVSTQFGCVRGRMRVSDIVKLDDAPDVVRLTSQESIFEWMNHNLQHSRKTFRLDIAGGGYPSIFSLPTRPNKSLDASGGGVFLIMTGPAMLD